MAQVLVRNLPDTIHRALRVRAALNNRSTEAEARLILSQTVLNQPRLQQPDERIKLGSFLARSFRAKLTDQELAIFERAQQASPARAARFE